MTPKLLLSQTLGQKASLSTKQAGILDAISRLGSGARALGRGALRPLGGLRGATMPITPSVAHTATTAPTLAQGAAQALPGASQAAASTGPTGMNWFMRSMSGTPMDAPLSSLVSPRRGFGLGPLWNTSTLTPAQ